MRGRRATEVIVTARRECEQAGRESCVMNEALPPIVCSWRCAECRVGRRNSMHIDAP